MDDVLSSIRRIIGSDGKKDDGDEPLNLEPGGGDQPMALGTPIRPGNAADEQASGGDAGAMPLTPNMRVDFSKLTDDNPLSGAGPASEAAPRPVVETPEPMPAPEPVPEPVDFLRAAPAPEESHAAEEDPYPEDEAVVIDEAALEEMIRRIVREEMAAQPSNDEAMRQIVREELMGETGQNISRNVQSLIQAEVKRLLADKG